MEKYCKEYISYLSEAKTERKAHDEAVAILEANEYKNIDNVKSALKPGDKVYHSNRGKTLMATCIGKRPVKEGVHIVGGHTDAPRIDLKPVPLYEDGEIVLLDTHYYGGIKKYQWVTMPLALHGVIVKQNGESVDVSIGEDPKDPVFVITDILPHLGKSQSQKKMNEGITGEGLNVLFGTIPSDDESDKDEAQKVKANILNLLNSTYGIIEEDLVSAELELVPAGAARELGFDRSMILGYGQDDRICAYAGLKALLDIKGTPEFTGTVLLCDKEEIGSVGPTGMNSEYFKNRVADLIGSQEGKNYTDLQVRRCLENSRMLSADVSALHDPNYPEVSSPNNMPVVNGGMSVSKYLGSGGKGGSNDASAEFMADIRRIFNDSNVIWQSTELGKVDEGGGGTIAIYMARYGIDVVDCGVALFSMHAPWEAASKFDTYMAYKGYKAFLEDKR